MRLSGCLAQQSYTAFDDEHLSIQTQLFTGRYINIVKVYYIN